MTTRELVGLRMIPVRLDVHGFSRPLLMRPEAAALPWVAGTYRAWRNAARELSSELISASESRNASVDSAPWFWLTRSSCRPSRQPPVPGVVQLQAQVVAAEEPLEGGAGLVQPERVSGRPG